jgi:hypothetical protein
VGVKNPAAGFWTSTEEKASMEVSTYILTLAIHPRSKVQGIQALSHNLRTGMGFYAAVLCQVA